MPPLELIHIQLTGAWRMMLGKADGLRMLDLSADGFWSSFFAIVIALPALFAGWVSIANEMAVLDPDGAGRLSLILRLAIVDLSSWVMPLVALALLARPAGIGDRFVHYVVASNWATAIVVWIMLPPSILGLFLVTLVLSWRLTNIAIGKGAAVATGVFVAMVAISLFVLFGMQDLLGLAG
jgi:hypothetical protein